ncbi:MAG TPA: DUF748 domain-containing protein [Planctomycetota bacterium]
MLTLISLVRKIFKNLKSDLTPAQLAVGAGLGALAGLTPFGLHLLLLFTIALLFNCSMATFLLVFGAFKPLGFLFAGTQFAVGVSLLSDPNGFYAGLIGWASSAPILAYMGFDRYIVAGGYAMSLPIALTFGVMTAAGVTTYRARLGPKMADAAWYQNAMKKWYFRFFKWVIAGKEKEAVAPKKRFVLLRPFRAYMVAFIPLLYIGLTVGGGLYAQAAINGLAGDALGRALGVKVTFGKIDYSFFGQRLAFENFQMPDPADTKTDLLRVGGFEADLGFVSLLSKRLRIEKLALKDVAARVVRAEDGKLNVTQVPAAKPADPAEEKAWGEWLDWLAKKGQETDWSEIWKKYQESRKKGEAEKKAEEAAGKKRPAPDYDASLTWTSPRADPMARVDLVEVKGFALAVEDRTQKEGKLPALTSVEGKIESLSTSIGWDGKPVALDLAGALGAGKLTLRGTWLPGKSDLEFKLADVPIVDYRGLYEKSVPVKVEGGKAVLSTAAGTSGGQINGKIQLRIDQLKIAAKPGEPKILGLDPEMSGYAIQGINAYGEKLPVAIEAGVKGPVEDPSIDAKLPFLEIAKKGLEMLGKAELMKYADRLGGEADKLKKAALDPAAKEAEKAVESLKKGDVKAVEESIKKAQNTDDAKKEVEKTTEGLKDLFKKKKDEKK